MFWEGSITRPLVMRRMVMVVPGQDASLRPRIPNAGRVDKVQAADCSAASSYHGCMRIFAYEYLSFAVLAGQPGADSLRREGLTMLAAALADFASCPGVEAVTLVHPDLAP